MDRVLNIPDTLQSFRALYKLLSTYLEEASSEPCQMAKMKCCGRITIPFRKIQTRIKLRIWTLSTQCLNMEEFRICKRYV